MSALYLIRHAQAGPRHKYDRLSETGCRQAQLLGEHLAAQRLEFTAAYVGGLERQRLTSQTVERCYQRAGVPFPKVQHDPCWDEFDLGDVYNALAEPLGRDDEQFAREYAEMMRYLEDEDHALHRDHNYCDIAVIRAWVANRYAYEGESWQAFRERVERPLENLSQYQSGEQIAVFTSATPISLWVGQALRLDEANIWRLAGVVYNTGITTFRLKDGDCRLFTFNGAPHLEPELRTFR